MLTKNAFKNLVRQCIAEVVVEPIKEAYNTYYTIVILKYDDAKPVIDLLQTGTVQRAIDYLKQWDYGGESEHIMNMTKTPPWGADDKTYKWGKYTLFYNPNFDYVGLVRMGSKLKEESVPEPYDDKTDTFQPSPRDRTEPVTKPKIDRGRQCTVYVKSGRLAGQIVSAVKKADGIYYYFNPSTGTDEPIGGEESVQVQNRQIKEAGEVKVNRLSNSERRAIGNAFAKVGLDGNGRFEKKEHGLSTINSTLHSLGFQLDMVSADLIMGDKGSRNFSFRRVNDPGADPFTEKPEIENSRIVFSWERLDGPTSQYTNSPSKFEILAYAS